MRTTTVLFTLLPALAAAVPASITSTAAAAATATDSSVTFGDATDPCRGLTGISGAACGLGEDGWNTAAANYLASELYQPGLRTAINNLEANPAVSSAIDAALTTVVDGQNTAPGVLAFSAVAAQITVLPSGSQRNQLSSILQQGFALQSNPSATGAAGPAATTTTGAAASGGASSASGAAAASSTSPSKAAAAAMSRQTGLGVAAGVAAGVIGLAVGL